MWIFTKNGFASIVQDENNRGNVLVRFRVEDDAKHFSEMLATPYTETPDADYRFRLSAPRSQVAEMLMEMTLDVDYPNFKNAACPGGSRSKAYHEVWNAMYGLQESHVAT